MLRLDVIGISGAGLETLDKEILVGSFHRAGEFIDRLSVELHVEGVFSAGVGIADIAPAGLERVIAYSCHGAGGKG